MVTDKRDFYDEINNVNPRSWTALKIKPHVWQDFVFFYVKPRSSKK